MRPQKPKPGNSFADLHPELLKEYSHSNIYSPWDIKPSSTVVSVWICPIHGEYSSSFHSRHRGRGCIYCGYESEKHSTPPYHKSLEARFPDIAATWSPSNTKKPSEVYARAGSIKYKWICPIHGEFQSTCANMTRKNEGNGCAGCRIDKSNTSRRTPTHLHSLGDLFPHLLKEYSPDNIRSPFTVTYGSGYRASWVCSKCGHRWQTSICERTGHKTGCPRCYNLGSSTTEQNLRSSLTSSGALPDSHKVGKWEGDIYIPESKTIVEYDGSYYHSSPQSYERDSRKSLDLLSQGYRVIRIREISNRFKLTSLNIQNPSYHEIFYENGLNFTYTKEPTPDLLDKLTSLL